MKPEKKFDCVELKRRLQKDLERKYAGLTDEERRQRIAHELATSDGPVARKWRAIAEKSRTDSRQGRG